MSNDIRMSSSLAVKSGVGRYVVTYYATGRIRQKHMCVCAAAAAVVEDRSMDMALIYLINVFAISGLPLGIGSRCMMYVGMMYVCMYQDSGLRTRVIRYEIIRYQWDDRCVI